MRFIFKIIKNLEYWALIVLMFSLTIITFLQVVFRLALDNPLAWSEEASRYLFVWTIFLGAAIVLSKSQHFKIDFIIEFLPYKMEKFFTYFSYLCVGVFSFILIKYGMSMQESASTQMTPALNLKMSWVYSIIPISGVLMILHIIEFIYIDIRKNGYGENKGVL